MGGLMARWRRQRRADDDGFTIVELLMSMAILLIISAMVVAGLTSVALINRSNRNRVAAAALVENQLESVRSRASSVAAGTWTAHPSVNGTNFTVTTVVWLAPRNKSGGACDAGAASGTTMMIYRVTATATWANMGSVKPVISQTEIVPPTIISGQQYNVGVKVVDRNTGPVVGQSVLLSPGSLTALTDADGCAFFANVGAGTYTATLGSAGWVDTALQQTSTSAAVGVPPATGVTAIVQMMYDRAGTVTLAGPTITTAAGPVTYQVPPTLPVTLLNSSSTALPKAYPAGSLPALFPFSHSGYQLWLGEVGTDGVVPALGAGNPCDPGSAAYGGPITVGPTTSTAWTLGQAGTTPGSPTDIEVAVPVAGTPVPGAQVYGTDLTCTGTTMTGIPLGTTDAQGFVHVYLPPGQWHFTARVLPAPFCTATDPTLVAAATQQPAVVVDSLVDSGGSAC